MVPSSGKSSIYLNGIPIAEEVRINKQVGFQSGDLPIRYLGAPLISTCLRRKDCIPLLERVKNKIQS